MLMYASLLMSFPFCLALNGNDSQLADKLHKALIHEHPNEVRI